MATRDLTVPYMRLRSAMHRGGARPNEDLSNPSSAGGAAGGAGLLGAAASATVDMTPLARTSPVYVDLVNEINGDINLITAKMSDLQKAHDARLRIAFNPQEENEKVSLLVWGWQWRVARALVGGGALLPALCL